MENNNFLQYYKMYDDVSEPIVGTEESAGADLKSYIDYDIKPNEIALINTGLKFKFPTGTYGKIENRSSMGLKNLKIIGGIIDRDYTGEIIVCLQNNNQYNYSIKKGDKIAQIICHNYVSPKLQEIKHVEETTRGTKGFGSTGI